MSDLDPSVFVHETALVESSDIGPRTRIWAFAHILEGASIGAGCNICDHVFIEGGARVGDRVTVKNNVMIWDRVTIEDEVFLGPNAVLTNDQSLMYKKLSIAPSFPYYTCHDTSMLLPANSPNPITTRQKHW